jgi:glycogen debranching enzyme
VANLLLLDGSTFFVSQENGDVEANQPEGFFFKDVRHLSEWRLLVDGEPLNPLTSRAVDYFSGRVVAAPEGKDPPLTVERDRFVTEGAHEDIVVSNHSSEERLLELDLCFAADFADVLEAEQPGAYGSQTKIDVHARSVTLSFEQDGFRRATRLSFNRKGELKRNRASFEVRIEPQGKWKLCIDLTPIEGLKPKRPLLRCDSFGAPEPEHGPYYGTHDATQLFLILLDEYERWTADTAFVRRLEPYARQALEWIDEEGDVDGDGFLEYESRLPVPYPDALAPQAWSAGAPLLALRTLLGLDVVDGRLRSRPRVPRQRGRIRLKQVPVRGQRSTPR